MTNIIFMIPYHGIEELVEKAFAERDDRAAITYQIIVSHWDKIPPLDLGPDDVIISRGFTALELGGMGIITLELKITGYDVIKAVNECIDRFRCRKLAVIGTPSMIYGADSLNDLHADVDVVCYSVRAVNQLGPTLARAAADGCQAVVGGHSAYWLALRKNIPAILLRSGKEAVATAIDEAVRLAGIRRAEYAKTQRMRAMMDYTFEGIICTDERGIVTLANRYARSVLPQNSRNPIGKPLSHYFANLALDETLRNNVKILSELHRLDSREITVNCVPMQVGDSVIGAMVTFQEVSRLQEEEGKLRKQLHQKGFVARHTFADIVAADPSTREAIRVARRYSESDSNLLIQGETGTGKEIYAQSIHNQSRRRNQPFVAINCASFPESLLESELFGYTEGAFTGAAKGGKMGLFELAHNGTLFLDEVGDVSAALQARLLRVIQEREIIRLGGDRVIPINVRLITATNKNLNREVDSGAFRKDLLHRLIVLKLHLPPLRQRRDDILPLVKQYIDNERSRTGCTLVGIASAAEPLLLRHPWPGNVREVRNFCERICVLCEKEYAGPDDVMGALEITDSPADAPPRPEGAPPGPGADDQRSTLWQTLVDNHFNRTRTAAALGIDKSTLWRRLKKYRMEV